MKQRGVMLPSPFDRELLSSWPKPYIVQPKISGERCRAVPLFKGCGRFHRWVLYSEEGGEITTLPHINANLGLQRLVKQELDGCLFSLSKQGPVAFWIFDIIDEEEKQERRTARLDKLRSNLFESLNVVRNFTCSDTLGLTQVSKIIFSELKYNGLIIRNKDAPYARRRVSTMMKLEQ